MREKSTENPEEDRVSLKSNGKTPTPTDGGGGKETLGTLGMLQTFRRSIRRVSEKGLKVTPKADAASNDSGSRPPPSPSLSAGSPVTSPLKNLGGLFQKKEEDSDSKEVPQKGKGLTRSKTGRTIINDHC
ncbi:hypothetical protein L3Q82_008161 [Scortum barcoo]|uniref:Uncharacterized protein n=1 Tax=Scortum barcoo TaxID=214431 RepID=A0ACB8WH31_9TELE|nr:hypothetical protein L3Q82_008161 [Scortum barcoo]